MLIDGRQRDEGKSRDTYYRRKLGACSLPDSCLICPILAAREPERHRVRAIFRHRIGVCSPEQWPKWTSITMFCHKAYLYVFVYKV